MPRDTFTLEAWRNVAETYCEADASQYVCQHGNAFAPVEAAADVAADDVLMADLVASTPFAGSFAATLAA